MSSPDRISPARTTSVCCWRWSRRSRTIRRSFLTGASSAVWSGPASWGPWVPPATFSRMGGACEVGALGAPGDLFGEGAMGSHTACLRTAYADLDTSGFAYLTASQVRNHAVACTRAGIQAGFHAIGDGAMEAVTRGFQEAADTGGTQAMRQVRHRIEHAEMIEPWMVAIMARLGVYASVQPAFDRLWGGTTGMSAQRLGPARALTLNPYAAMQAGGVVLALGSDSPVTPLDPWGTVRAAVHHRTRSARMNPGAAFAAETRGGWG